MIKIKTTLFFLLLLLVMEGCERSVKVNDYLISFYDTIKDGYGYKNQNGKILIPSGKYQYCYTDTFKTYAIVVLPKLGMVAINRNQKVMYQVFPFDNGPDNAAEGLYRIMENKKIGYADAVTGEVIIPPQFDCAWPFEAGIAKVSTDCISKSDGEHETWSSDHWFYIDKKGQKTANNK